MTKCILPKLKGLLLVSLFLTMAIACQSEKSEDITAMTEEQDSILSWIERAKNSDLPANIRQKWLEKALDEASDLSEDSLKTEIYSKISLAYLKKKDSLNFRKTSRQTIELASRTRDSVNHAEAHWDMATFFKQYDIADSAYYHYGEAQKIYKAINDDLFNARMLRNMGMIQVGIKDYVGAEINTIKAIELLKPLKEDKHLFSCYNSLGIISRAMGEYDRAIDYYSQAYEYQKASDTDKSQYRMLQNNIGNIYKEQEMFDKAIPFYREALRDTDLINRNPGDFAVRLTNLASSRIYVDDTVGVASQFRSALEILDSINDISGQSLNYYNLSEYQLFRKDTIAALQTALRTLDLATRSNNNDRLLRTYQLLAKIDPLNASTYASAYIKLNDSFQMQERKIRDKFARIQFETDEFIEQNRLLAQQRQLWIGIALGVLLLAIAIFIIINQRTKNEKLRFEQQQQQANQEIFNLMLSTSQKVEEGKHDEQKRISEELHDGVLGQMNGVRMVLLGLNKKSDENSVNMRSEAIEKLQEVQEEIRTISHELSDAAYQKFHNFIISIRDLVQTISQASEIPCEFTYDQDTEWDDLSGEIKINLYRIVQEGLQNCVKYSEANLIKLNFDANESELLISLIDDGVGFDSKKVKKGIGHKNINSRLGKIGGRWEIESAPGKGTKMKINVPYVRNSRTPVLKQEQVLEKETLD